MNLFKSKTMKIVMIVVVVLIILFGFGAIELRSSILSYRSAPSDDLNASLSGLVSYCLQKDKSIKNITLSVMKGDRSYSWSGAAGISNEESQSRMTKDTPIYIASITKLYTAAVIMKLYEQGSLSLDDPMSKYLPPSLIRGIHIYKGKDYSNEITIKQLLAQTSGIADYYEEKGKDGKSAFDILVADPNSIWTVDGAIARTRDELQPHFAPGTGAFYSDTNFLLLGKIIENIAQKPLETVYEDYIFRPCGCTHTWLVNLSKPQVASGAPADIFYNDTAITKMRLNGADWADGGIISTVDDMIIFLKALNDGKIISSNTLNLMHDWHKMSFPMQYGFGTMYFRFPTLMEKVTGLTPIWGHSGSTGSFLYYSEELDLYMAGTIDTVGADVETVMLMSRVMNQFRVKSKAK